MAKVTRILTNKCRIHQMYKKASQIKHHRDTKPKRLNRRPLPDYRNAIYIGNLPDRCQKTLRQLLLPYGLRKGPYLVRRPLDDLKAEPYRFAFANMRSTKAVERVIKELDGSPFQGKRISIKVARKSPK